MLGGTRSALSPAAVCAGSWNLPSAKNAKGEFMPRLTVQDVGEFEVESGKRLVSALEENAGIDQLHACGGKAKCTTCRVEFVAGEPSRHSQAELDCLRARELSGVRLSCQILCEQDMTVRAISRLAGSGRADAGGPVSPEMEPQPVQWVES